ncbi:MAG: hypothetical protein JW739_06675 [Opitutales bacterium]|nr:hypothetical protein [Opitutales bacterium]
MESEPNLLFPLLTFAGCLCATVGCLLLMRKSFAFSTRRKQMEKLSKSLGIAFDRGIKASECKAEGLDAEGNQLHICHKKVSLGPRKHPLLEITLKVDNAKGIGFNIASRSSTGDLGSKLGIKPLETGIDTFDQGFVVKSKDEQEVKSLLNEEIRALCHVTWDEKGAHGLLKLKGTELIYSESGSLFSDLQVRRLESAVSLMKLLKTELESLT